MGWRIAWAALLFLGCGDVGGEVGAPLTQAIGEPIGTFPSPEERLMIMAINRARSDPATVKGPNSTVFPAKAPVSWSYDLSRASRFHATNMQSAGVTLMHTSPCTLNTNVGTSGCSGVTSCACATAVPTMCTACKSVAAINTCGTDTFTRIGYFTNIANGEVAAAGYQDTFSTVAGWVNEAAGADGHRKNLLDVNSTSNTMGAGRVAGTGCWSSFDVSDSGRIQGQVLPKMPTGSVKPVRGPAGTFTFYVTWADAQLGAPSLLSVVIDGTCHPMTRELGTATLNSTWIYSGALTSGCHSYYFLGRDGASAQVHYPTMGALNVSVGNVACTADYVTQAPAASCATVMPDLLPPRPPDLSTTTTTLDQASPPGADLTPPPGADLTGGSSGGDDLSTGSGPGVPRAGCGCAVGARSPSTSGALALALAAALLLVLTRRRGRGGA